MEIKYFDFLYFYEKLQLFSSLRPQEKYIFLIFL